MKQALREMQTLRTRWCSKVRTPPARCKHANTETGPIATHCAAKLSAQAKGTLIFTIIGRNLRHLSCEKNIIQKAV